ncbi:probable RNA-binding protein EIF1AD [Cyclopterus lumpus]|uniref:Probable RNA-binding protein EIF1AD n=1 Tax=Cyclopterus lumpus TaxID=8103 RepID=A0A8C3ABG3_CYCLU|nr:probable RNA-binding protein EIF1AD [Cyclopterus lumpus]XP_034400217.1 probable RNA-binding protein EIF1AD [Cyclopterus lumpus]
MSQATKRKHVVMEVLGDFVTPTANQQIVKVTGSRGNNLHEAVTAQGVRFLVSMPPKFRKNLWIKRGDYVIVDPIEEGEKVKAEISFILYKDHIQYLQKQQLWPEGFTEEPDKTNKEQEKEEETEEKDKDLSDSEDESDLFVNTNRCNYHYTESEEEDSEEEEDADKDKEKRTENGS